MTVPLSGMVRMPWPSVLVACSVFWIIFIVLKAVSFGVVVVLIKGMMALLSGLVTLNPEKGSGLIKAKNCFSSAAFNFIFKYLGFRV